MASDEDFGSGVNPSQSPKGLDRFLLSLSWPSAKLTVMRHPAYLLIFSIVLLLGLGLLIGCGQPAEETAAEALPPEDLPPPKPKPGDWVTVPAGEFKMGSDERPERSKNQPQFYEPEHTVETKAYEMLVFEVTNGQFAKFQIESDYAAEGNWRQFYSIGKEDYPVANVTHDDANEFCKWAGGRLPTEAEWEKAARGPEGFLYPWGDKWDPTKSNCNEMGFANLVQVGQLETDVSGYGVHDMMGNVQEWTADKFAPYPDSPARRDVNFTRGYISARGGSYAIKGGSIFLYTRGAYLPKAQYGIGFRCVKDAEGEGGEAQPGS